MKRIFSEHAYGAGPRTGCWWDETIAAPDWPEQSGELSVDVGIVGGGFTGISAALTLAEAGLRVAVLEAMTPAWGASGRNGGFCCLGGSRLSDAELRAKFGEDGCKQHHATERKAIELVSARLAEHGIDADRHSQGETMLAHSPRAMEEMRGYADSFEAHHGMEAQVSEQDDLAAQGMNAGFFGAVTIPLGFGLNPRKYLVGIAGAAQAAGAMLFQRSPVLEIDSQGQGVTLTTAGGRVRCDRAIVATNGYSSEDLPDWLGGRYLPSQSNVSVTRPMTDEELEAQGWTTLQASYDSRNLLHYFRLMPDKRFLFGNRGGILSTPGVEAAARKANRRDFERMFPAWKHVETPHQWSGMVCVSRTKAPFIGAVPGHPGLYASMCYHGNGVAMASWSGTQMARVLLDPQADAETPPSMRVPLTKFPLGPLRRAFVPPMYALLKLGDLR